MWASAKLGSASVALRQFCSAACVCNVSILARPSSKKARALADWVDISIPAGCCPAEAASAKRKIATIKDLTRVETILIDFSLGRAPFFPARHYDAQREHMCGYKKLRMKCGRGQVTEVIGRAVVST